VTWKWCWQYAETVGVVARVEVHVERRLCCLLAVYQPWFIPLMVVSLFAGEVGGYRQNPLNQRRPVVLRQNKYAYQPAGPDADRGRTSGRGAAPVVQEEEFMQRGKKAKKRQSKNPKFSSYKLAAGEAWPRRVPKTKDNPKGRHKLHKIKVEDNSGKGGKGEGKHSSKGGKKPAGAASAGRKDSTRGGAPAGSYKSAGDGKKAPWKQPDAKGKR
jgi:hypothetical protein